MGGEMVRGVSGCTPEQKPIGTSRDLAEGRGQGGLCSVKRRWEALPQHGLEACGLEEAQIWSLAKSGALTRGVGNAHSGRAAQGAWRQWRGELGACNWIQADGETGSSLAHSKDPGWAPHPGGPGCPSLTGMWGDPSAGEEGHAVITQALRGVGRRSLVLAPWTWLRHLTGTHLLSEPAQRNQKCSPQPTALCSFNKAPLLVCPRHKANHRGTI